MNRSTPGLRVHHQLPESNLTHVHWVGDAIQPSHPLYSPSPPTFNLSQHQGLFQWYAEYMMWNAGLDKAQAGIKISERNTNNFRYTDDTTLIAEIEEELKSLWMNVKEESEKVDLKLNIQKTQIMASGPIPSWK